MSKYDYYTEEDWAKEFEHCDPENRTVTLSKHEIVVDRDVYDDMLKALAIVAAWELPPSNAFVGEGKHKRELTYEAAYGSNGARNYMRNLASNTLKRILGDSYEA